MMKRINYLGLLSLLALVAILGYTSGNHGLYGFLGFAYYIRYFWVIPDELFLLNLQRASTLALLAELLSLVPFLFGSYLLDLASPLPLSFGLSFAVAILVFTVALNVLEWKESRGLAHD